MTQSSSGLAFRRLGIPSIKNITNLFLIFCFIGTGIHGGIKEDVEKIIKSQYGDSIVFAMKKLSLGKQDRTQIEHKVHQRFFKDFLYIWTIEQKDGEEVIEFSRH